MKSFTLAVVVIFLIGWVLPGKSAPLPEYTNEEDVDDELYMVEEIWNGRGEVIVGKIDPLPPGVIACRTPVGKDGGFTAAVYRGQELTFYLHGYDKLSVAGSKRVGRSVFDAGIVQFTKTSSEDIRRWETKVEAPGYGGEIKAALKVVNLDYLFDDHGYSGGSRPYAQTEVKTIKPGETIVFDGLSPIPYEVELSGPGLIRQRMAIDPEATGVIQEEEIVMTKAPVLEFTFRSRTRKEGAEWKEEALKQKRVSCDGKAELLLTEVRDGLGNTLELRLEPTVDGIKGSFFYYDDKNFVELGEGEAIEDLLWGNMSRTDGLPYPILQSGHRYLLQVKDVNGLDLETLFSVRKVH